MSVLLVGLAGLFSDSVNIVLFKYGLPFLVIFAFIYGVLTKSKIFGDDAKAINAIVSLAVGLLALQFDIVPNFFAAIMPRLGIGIAVLLVVVILLGVFIVFKQDQKDQSDKWNKYLPILGGIIALAIILSAFSNYWNPGQMFYGFWDVYGSAIIALVLIVGLVIAIVVATKK